MKWIKIRVLPSYQYDSFVYINLEKVCDVEIQQIANDTIVMVITVESKFGLKHYSVVDNEDAKRIREFLDSGMI